MIPCSTVAEKIQYTMILLQRYEGQERGAHAETVIPADLAMRCGTQLSLYKYETWIGGGTSARYSGISFAAAKRVKRTACASTAETSDETGRQKTAKPAFS